MDYQTLLYGVENRVALIRLNRPKALNALTPELLTELRDAIERAGADEAVGAIVLTGEGRGFSSGADLVANAVKPPIGADGKLDLGLALETTYNPLVLQMRACPKPIVAAVNGMAAGAGASIALLADLTVAARSAYFLQAFVNIGLIPDAGGTWILPRLVGQARARGLALLAEPLGAEKAEAWGLIWKAVDDGALMAEAEALCAHFATAPTYGLGLIKQALDASEDNDLSTQLDLERKLQRQAGSHEDYKEGVRAFLAKRKPVFSGKR